MMTEPGENTGDNLPTQLSRHRLAVDQQIGNYRLLERIGAGGMAQVYRALQVTLNREVAIKLLSSSLLDDQSFLIRFQREAEIAAKLDHPAILPTFDYGENNGNPYIVMPYVRGGTLKELLKKGPLPLPLVVSFLEQLADALNYAHTHGVIHRDIKPANILMRSPEHVMLADFGIARLLSKEQQQLTATGLGVGTPEYMAPEQAQGKAEIASDIYSLGVVLYEMLSGVVPFRADTPVGVLMRHLTDPLPSIRQLNPQLPASIEPVLARVLAKTPGERYPTALAFAQDVRRALSPGTVISDPAVLPTNPGVAPTEYQTTKQVSNPLAQPSAPTLGAVSPGSPATPPPSRGTAPVTWPPTPPPALTPPPNYAQTYPRYPAPLPPVYPQPHPRGSRVGSVLLAIGGLIIVFLLVIIGVLVYRSQVGPGQANNPTPVPTVAPTTPVNPTPQPTVHPTISPTTPPTVPTTTPQTATAVPVVHYTATDLFPLVNNAEWHYREENGTEDIYRTVPDTTLKGQSAMRYEHSVNGKVTDAAFYVAKGDGIFDYEEHFPGSGRIIAFADTPVELLPNPVHVGQHWDVNSTGVRNDGVTIAIRQSNTVLRQEQRITEAGTFQTLVVEVKALDGDGNVLATEIFWYAKGVGIVRTELHNSNGIQIKELTSYTIPR